VRKFWPGFHRCGLTNRSSGAPTAAQRARATVQVCIFCSAGPLAYRRRPLSSNVRPRNSEVLTVPSSRPRAALTPISQLVKCASRRPAKAGSQFVGHAEYGVHLTSENVANRTSRRRDGSWYGGCRKEAKRGRGKRMVDHFEKGRAEAEDRGFKPRIPVAPCEHRALGLQYT
jgi:hypothetical protein